MRTRNIGWAWVVLVVVGVFSARAQAPFPKAINYQGKLMDGTNLYSGDASVVFRIYDTDDTNMEPHLEQSNTVTVVDGLYSTLIGDPDGSTDWWFLDRPMEYLRLMVEINGTPLTPMERLVGVPYALLADGVKYQGITRDMIGLGMVNNNHMDMWAITAYNILPGTITAAEIANQTITLSNLAQSGAVTGQVIKYSAAGWVAADVGSGGGVGVTGLVSYAESGTFIANPVAGGTDSIAQGSGARALSDYSVVGGGRDNQIAASANYGVIAGGYNNDNAGSWAAAIGGGWENQIGTNSTSAVIGGGMRNQIRSNVQQATIAGGNTNVIWGGADFASIGGGRRNVVLVDAADSTIGGGDRNMAAGEGAVIGGGRLNQANMGFATIGGGYSNQADSAYAVIGGGGLNQAAAANTTVSGGFSNQAEAASATVGGGSGNKASGAQSTIGGGLANLASMDAATVAGGSTNIASGIAATVGGGRENTASAERATVGGGQGNEASGRGAVVGGGWWNTASGHRSTVSGGTSNTASGYEATIGGGFSNSASASSATVSGGEENTASEEHAAVGGGRGNVASGIGAAVGGGWWNTASGDYATVPGGYWNTASNKYAFAAGRRARANHEGSFVWGDSLEANISSTTNNQVTFRCGGGVRFYGHMGEEVAWTPGDASWTFSSDRELKEGFAPVNGREVLEKVASLPIAEWSFKGHTQRHIGPMAQDFHAAFALEGASDTALNSLDLDGVALAAIQGLHQQNQDLIRKNEELEARLERLEAALGEQAQ